MNSNEVLKRIRETMGLSQQAFAALVGRSYQSIRSYEAGVAIPPEVLERAKKLVAERGFADLALDLMSSASATPPPQPKYEVKHVLRPGERLISTHPAHPAADKPPSDRFHRMLDEIIAAGNADVTNTVESVIILAHRAVHAETASKKKSAHNK